MTTAVLIGGANGAGKTTFARSLVPLLHPGAAFLNADEVAREGYAPLAAGREVLRRLDACVAARAPFVLETTLSSRRYAARIPAWRAAGYAVTLHFIEVPDADFAVVRVARRVRAGGHDVPETDVRRRYARGLALFDAAYKPVVDYWAHYRTGEDGLVFVTDATA